MGKKTIHLPAILITLCVALSIFRALWLLDLCYMFLIWNVFLAWIPFYFSGHLNRTKSTTKGFAITALIVLFLPNAPYLLTDLIHFRSDRVEPTLWYDLILFFSYAVTGLVLTIVVTERISHFLHNRFGKALAWLTIGLSFPAMGFGIYLGRVERLNSWDAVLHPFRLTRTIFSTLFSPELIKVIQFSLGFGCFIAISYLIYKALSRSAIER